jgi:putative hydrolase of the HAD superfamily
MCDELVYSHEEGLLKPDPRSYGIVCQRLGVPAERCVFLDDTPAHVDGARAAGLKAVTFLDNDRTLRELGRLLDAPA